MVFEWLSGGSKSEVIDDPVALKKGRVTLRGNLLADPPLRSPLNGRDCAAFYYRATYNAHSRMKGFIRRKLRDALVYGEGLALEMGDVRVELVPEHSDEFTRDHHKALKADGIEGFDAREQVMRVGAEVFARGVLRWDRGAWTMKLASVELTPEEEARKARAATKPKKATSKSKAKGGPKKQPKKKKKGKGKRRR